MPNTSYTFSISISREEYLKYYAGRASTVRTTTAEGFVIDFPANNLTPWITHSGINGTFRITMNEDHKLIDIKQL